MYLRQQRILTISLVMALILALFLPARTMAAGITPKNLKVKTSWGSVQVRAVYIDLNDPKVRIWPVLARNQIGLTESLQSMAKRSKAAVAINGTFFSAYSDMQPQGTLQINSTFHYLSNTGSSLGITRDGQVRIENLRFKISGQVDGPSKANLKPWEQFQKNWYAWSINRVDTNPSAITIYTPAKGKTTGQAAGTNIVVKGGFVSGITNGSTAIPVGGYVINFGSASSAQQYVPRFQIGDSVTYQINMSDPGGIPVDWANVAHTVGAGPMLVRNGIVDVNFTRDGMKDPKLTTNSGARSFIGLTASNQLVMATVPRATIRQLAEIARSMGLKQAMNLDGGASSGLYCGGKYLTTPGRNLSNCLVVTY